MSRPTLAVTMWRRAAPTFLSERTVFHTLVEDYAQALDRAGATMLAVGPLDPDEAPNVLARVDGLVVTGGGDLNPDLYGAPNTSSGDIDTDADARDLALIATARELGMPTLGICRGLQAMNVACGGTLHQEVNGASAEHPALAERTEDRNAHRHDVHFMLGCRLARAYASRRRSVNSLHHQAVDRLGEGLQIVGTTADTGVEAIEAADPNWWAVGVQWHPEMLADPIEARLFEAFVNEVVAYGRR
jgi:putative glutamine amidotransferase